MASSYVVTVCSEYPIHEAAEGGYYYAGIHASKWVICKRMKTARKLFKQWAREYGYDMGRKIKGQTKRRYHEAVELPLSHYIGENCYIVMQGGNRPYESGWHPYE